MESEDKNIIQFSDVNDTELYKKFSNLDFLFQNLFNEKEEESKRIEIFFDYFKETPNYTYFYIKLLSYFAEVRANDRKIVALILKKIFEDFPDKKSEYLSIFNSHSYMLLTDIAIMEKFIEENDEYGPNPLIYDNYEPNSFSYFVKNDMIDQLKQSLYINTEYNINQPLYQDSTEGLPQYLLYKTQTITLLDISCYFGAINCFKYFIMNNCEISEYTADYAIAGGNFEIIHIVEQKKVSFDETLPISIEFHRNDISNWLLLNYNTSYQLKDSIQFYDIPSFIYKIIHKDYTGNEIYDILEYSCNTGMIQILQFGLDDLHLDPNYHDDHISPPISTAIFNHQTHIINYLINQKHVNISIPENYLEFTPILLASREGLLDTIKLLIQNGADPNEKCHEYTPLILAVRNKNISIVRYLIEEQHVMFIKNNLLLLACENGDLPMIQYFIEKQHADIHVNEKGKTLLHIACFRGNVEVIKYLMNLYPFDVEAKDEKGQTPLFYAVQSLNNVEYLVEELHANVNQQDKKGCTPLHYCTFVSQEHYKYLYEYLCQHGADPDIKDKSGDSPKDILY